MRGHAGLHPPRPADPREAEADEVARRAAAHSRDEAGVRREVGSLLGRDFSRVRVRPGAADLERESFTPAVYGALAQGGGSLGFAPGSEWMPEALRKNLQATLEKVLDPALTPTATQGVKVRDFSESFSPPDPDHAGSYERDYDPVFQFAFLVDRKGRIHIRPGSTPELRTVTGEPGGLL